LNVFPNELKDIFLKIEVKRKKCRAFKTLDNGTARTSRNQKGLSLSGKLQITNPKLQTWGVLRTDLNAFGVDSLRFF
jgi:hypothetical protein